MTRLNIETIQTHASGRWPEILLHLAPHLSPMIERGRKHGPCALCGGKDRARCHDDFNETGGVYCNQCRGGAKGLSVLCWANTWSIKEAMASVSSFLGLTSGQPLPPIKTPVQPAESAKDWAEERKRLESIWRGTIADNGRIAEYLQHRGLDVAVPETLRLHPRLFYFHQGPDVWYPAMIAKIQRDGETIGLHITYLDPEGNGKAPCSKPRKIRKCVENISGGSIQLFPPKPDRPLAISEGIESGLAIRDISGFPVWCGISSTMLEKIQIPKHVHRVYIGADKDRSGAGKRAARKLAQRLWDEDGRGATVSLPSIEIPDGKKSIDWLDYVAQGQEVACG